jgi:hypothetical protein
MTPPAQQTGLHPATQCAGERQSLEFDIDVKRQVVLIHVGA